MLKFLTKILAQLVDFVNSMNWQAIISITSIVLLIYLIVSFIAFHISLYFIFKKENIKPIYSFIPFYNLYLTFKYFHISLYTLFIPIVNIFAIIGLPYNIARSYRCAASTWSLAIIFPYVILPICAFSNRKSKYYQDKKFILRDQQDIYDLESKMGDTKEVKDYELVLNPEAFEDNFKMNVIDELDHKLIESEYVKINEEDLFAVTDETANMSIPNQDENRIEDINNDSDDVMEIIDLSEDTQKKDLDIQDIDNLSNLVAVDSSQIQEISADKIVKQKNKDDVTLAFGGRTQTQESTHSKVDELKCTRCGSSLVGNNGYCPGCGIKL